MIYILYTNDYEVFLGGNYRSEKEVLIDSTDELLKLCESCDIPMTLFSDVCCMWRYREIGNNDLPDRMEAQLKTSLRNGHDVQAHIHPHWNDTEVIRRDDGSVNYKFDFSNFLLSGSANSKKTDLYVYCQSLFKRASAYLTGLLSPIDKEYKCVAFRAGGFGLQPDSGTILRALENTGFRVDSTIAPGMYLSSNVNRIDFRNMPAAANYCLSSEKQELSCANRGIFEIPIAAAQVGSWSLLRNSLKTRYVYNRQYEPEYDYGYPVQVCDRPKQLFYGKVNKLLKYASKILRAWDVLELSPNPDHLFDVTKKYIRQRLNGKDNLLFSFLCHAKGVRKIHLDALREYHHKIKQYYGDDIEAITFQKAVKMLDACHS